MRLSLRRFYEGLDESQWWDAKKLHAFQVRHLTELVQHARMTSPFYRFRLQSLVRPNGFIDLENWEKVPIITRADLAANFQSMLSRAPVAAHGPSSDVSTSGSTGEPVTIRVTGWTMDMVRACNWRAQKWYGIDWSKKLIQVNYKKSKGKNGDRLGPWGPPWDKVAARGSTILHFNDGFAESEYEQLQRSKPGYMAIATGSVEPLCELNLRAKTPLRMLGFLTRGSAIHSYMREAAAESFGADMYGLYSAKEAGPIAHPCPDHDHNFHVNDESVLVEIVDDEGKACPPGVLGRVIVTPFTSTALPLIRYDQGDVAVAGETCSCGRGLRVIERIVGRAEDLFKHPDGRVFRANGALEDMREMIGARRWQVAQVGPKDYEIRLPAATYHKTDNFFRCETELAQRLFGDSKVNIIADAKLNPGASGKIPEYVNEWASPDEDM